MYPQVTQLDTSARLAREHLDEIRLRSTARCRWAPAWFRRLLTGGAGRPQPAAPPA